MSQATPLNWSYSFSDGSHLVGRVCGELDKQTNRLLNPTQIEADYFDEDGQTVLGSWSGSDFACFDLTLDGSEIVIVASNDYFAANSMCLVECASRNRAQVTDWGSQLVGEPFALSAWSVREATSPVLGNQSALRLDWLLPPALPLVSWRFTWRLSHSRTIYQWTFSPYLPFAPVWRVGQT